MLLNLIYLLVIYKLIAWTIRRWFLRKEPKAGTVVLITGGVQGLGRETALLYARRNCKVVIWDVQTELFPKIKSEISKAGGSAYCYKCDISNKQEVDAIARKTLDDLGKVDILINNAAITTHLPYDQFSEAEIRRVNDINYLGHVWVTLAFLPYVSHIGVIASVLSYMGAERESDYCASKFAINGYFSSLRLELKAKKSPIKITIVYPYHIRTQLFDVTQVGIAPYLLKTQEPYDVAKVLYDGICEKREAVYAPALARYACMLLILLPSQLSDYLIHALLGPTIIYLKTNPIK